MTSKKSSKKIYFIRHGQSELNAAGRYAGHTETPLTEEGRQQARAAGQLAKKHNIEYIISSPLGRALETAQIVAAELDYPLEDIHVDELFIERNYGDLEDQPYTPGFDYNTVNGIETDTQIIKRAEKALTFIENLQADSILIVSHGSLGRAIRFHLEPETPFEVRIHNADLQNWNAH